LEFAAVGAAAASDYCEGRVDAADGFDASDRCPHHPLNALEAGFNRRRILIAQAVLLSGYAHSAFAF
jgi:hypothetical protein